MHFLKSFDCFGSPMPIQITHNQSVYKSTIGGIFSICLIFTSLLYTAWMMTQWQSNQLSPKISTITFKSDFKLLNLNENFIHVYFWKQTEDQIDPFKEKILLPFVSQNQLTIGFNSFKSIEVESSESYNGAYVLNPMINFDQQSSVERQNQSVTTELVFMLCEQSYMPEGENCPSQDIIDKFFQQKFNTILVDVGQKTLNPLTKMEEMTFQQFFIQIELEFCQGLNIQLSTTRYQVQDAFIYGASKLRELVSQASAYSQTNSQSYCANYYNYKNLVSYIFISLDINQKLTLYEYPNLGDILANIGSIVSVLFSARYIIQQLNTIYLKTQLVDLYISFYNPQFQKISVTRNWFNKIKQVKYEDQELEIKEYSKFYEDVSQKIRMKMSFSNIFYELSRLYFLIRSFKTKEEMQKCHMLGIKLALITKLMSRLNLFSDIFPTNMIKSNSNDTNKGRNIYLLEKQDLDLLSLNKRVQYNYNTVDEELTEEDFYQINRCV